VSNRVIGAIFTTKSQENGAGRFTVPADVCQMIGVDIGSTISVQVESGSGSYGPVTRTLKSDREPSPVGEMRDWMRPGETITVTVRRDPA